MQKQDVKWYYLPKCHYEYEYDDSSLNELVATQDGNLWKPATAASTYFVGCFGTTVAMT